MQQSNHMATCICEIAADLSYTTLPGHFLVTCRFVTALTRGGPNGMPRPIELNAHDPRRYIADMLAWVHQAMASERELIISLFGQDEQSNAANSSQELRSDLPSSSALLNRVMEGICRPLKVVMACVKIHLRASRVAILFLSYSLTEISSLPVV